MGAPGTRPKPPKIRSSPTKSDHRRNPSKRVADPHLGNPGACNPSSTAMQAGGPWSRRPPLQRQQKPLYIPTSTILHIDGQACENLRKTLHAASCAQGNAGSGPNSPALGPPGSAAPAWCSQHLHWKRPKSQNSAAGLENTSLKPKTLNPKP